MHKNILPFLKRLTQKFKIPFININNFSKKPIISCYTENMITFKKDLSEN